MKNSFSMLAPLQTTIVKKKFSEPKSLKLSPTEILWNIASIMKA